MPTGRLQVAFASKIMTGLVESSFAQDEHGVTIFYPLGRWSRGRVLPNAEIADRLRKALRTTYWIACFVAAVVVALAATSFHGMTWGGILVIVALTLASGFAVKSWLLSLVRGFPISDRSLTLRDMSRTGLQVSLLCAVAFGVISMMIALAELGTASRIMALVGIVFFGACAVSNWLALQTLDPNVETDESARLN